MPVSHFYVWDNNTSCILKGMPQQLSTLTLKIWSKSLYTYLHVVFVCTTKMQQIGRPNFVENIPAREEAFLIALYSNSSRAFPSCMLIFCIYAQNIITTVTSLFLNLSELVILPHFQGYGEGILSQILNLLLIKLRSFTTNENVKK